ncbi:MAG: serine/threonine-protein kinase, partial [Bacteroidota bacterium]
LVPDALDRDPTERDAFLDEACRTPTGEIDAALRAEAASLVAAAEAATGAGSFASPVSGVASDAHASGSTMPSAAAPPETVGPWRVTGVLGEGGQGVVYRAVRADGAFEREVALKLLRPGAQGQAWARLAARLGEERRVLARLEHEGIARLYDGGLDGDGRPYLAMELVRGQTLTHHAGSAGGAGGLTVRQRVALMADVADAVAYAHARLVVHRDLKPSNVLVDEAGQPKLLDFGVAKLLGDEVVDPDLTVPGWMTPAYAAPEQVRRDEITTATDVYALGILAYEVLTGQRPYDVSGLDPATFQRTVCEVVPPRASDTAVQVAPSRAKALRGDLDTILAKTLAKEPERRYPTAEALSADLRRWLDDLPVEARQPTAGYRVGRFVRRHRAGVLGTAAALAVVVGVATTAFARVSNERDRAETEAAKSEAVNDFILGILGESDPYQSGREVTVAEALDQAAERADSALIDEPEVEGIVRYHLGTTYLTLSRVEESEREFERAIELFRGSVGPDHANTIDALNGLAFVYFTRGEFDRADAPLREALRAARTHGDDE